jgi:hypothetical protein
MSKWILNSVTADMNPSKDTGWFPELVSQKQHIPGSNYSLIQISGKQSEIRECSGITKSSTVKANLLACVGLQVTLVDHYGVSNTVLVESVVPDEKMDITNLGVGTFAYTMKMMKIA